LTVAVVLFQETETNTVTKGWSAIKVTRDKDPAFVRLPLAEPNAPSEAEAAAKVSRRNCNPASPGRRDKTGPKGRASPSKSPLFLRIIVWVWLPFTWAMRLHEGLFFASVWSPAGLGVWGKVKKKNSKVKCFYDLSILNLILSFRPQLFAISRK
jgi:hypothetical protein